MKKKTRRLLAITLAVCIGLVLSAGMASAKITTTDGTEIQQGNTLTPDTMVKSDASGGMEITYFIPAFDPNDKDSGDTDIAEIAANEETALIPGSVQIYGSGYEIIKWTVESITSAAPGDVSAKDILKLQPVIAPIQYIIEYYDSDKTTLLHRDENVTVENAEQFVSPAPTRDDYVLSHWVPVSSGGEFAPGISMDPFFLATQGDPDQGFVIKLYAVWEKPAAPAPEPEEPLDDSPQAGDDIPLGILILVMTIVAIGTVAVSRRKSL